MRSWRNASGFKAALGVVVVVLGGVAACSDEKRDTVRAQMAARVNAEEISVEQVHGLLAAHAAGADTKDAAREALDRLIDRELLAQQAQKQQIENNPQVVKALEAARKEILAKAYLEHISTQLTKPDAKEVAAFYNANPALFSDRKIFALRKVGLVFPASADAGVYIAEVQALFANGGGKDTLEKLVAWAAEHDIKVSQSNDVKAAEDLPIDMLPKFAALEKGDVGYLRSKEGLVAFRVLSITDAPITEAAAQSMIESILTASRRTDMVAAEMRRLRESAYIEYGGEFSDTVLAVITPGT